LMLGTTARRLIVPDRMQSVAELAYEFVANTICNTIGEGGMRLVLRVSRTLAQEVWMPWSSSVFSIAVSK
jgi:F0F1-type ATP synthase membrane subunit a